jgi:hypothetical protein
MTWNAANLARGMKELSLSHLLNVNKVDVAIITEAELPATMAPSFSIDGYTPFLPVVGPNEKTRVLALIKSDLAVRAGARLRMDLMTSSVQTLWLELDQPNGNRLVIGGVYRQWTSSSLATSSHQSGLAMERERLDIILNQVKLASQSAKAIIALGDFNLDAHRSSDASYSRRSMLRCLVEGMEAAGLDYVPTPPTWRSYGRFAGGHHVSCLDHVYCMGVDADVEVLEDATSDHRPILARIKAMNRSTSMEISRRNFKAIKQVEMQAALQLWPWGDIHGIEDVEEAHKFIMRGIIMALDVVAPYQTIRVRRGDNLYLSSETLDVMEIRDRATGKEYRRLRNKVSSMVKRDRLRTNLDKLRKANNDPKVLWGLANSALGKSKSSLPASLVVDGISTVGNTEAAAAMNGYYIEKVEKLRAGLCPVSPPSSHWPNSTSPFHFSFASAGKITKVIAAMKNTEALGLDGIPVSVLKKGVEVLASPIAHLINRSLASGIVPDGFKSACVIPIHKGKGKNTADPASYRPVSILPALSKVLELVVKADLESHFAKVGALPNTQFGFRPGRSCTAALATAQAKWIQGSQEGNVVGILAFDLTAAFDTVDKAQLLPKLAALGIKGSALAWFTSYLSGGKQCIDWNGTRSSLSEVKFGVRQGSILGPILYLVLVADMPDCLGIGEEDNSGYADDTAIWAVGRDLASVRALLEERADAFARFATGNGLILNAAKTQLMLGGNIKNRDVASFSVLVDGIKVSPAKEMELLGVKFDNNFTTAPHDISVAKSARQRATLIARLAHHLPRGEYLRQLARGLVIGKISFAMAAVVAPRLGNGEALPSAAYKSVQVAINDVARSITGRKRTDHVKIPSLLYWAGLPSVNELAVRAVAMESWKANHSSDGKNGGRNPIGKFIFPATPITYNIDTSRTTRSRTAGIIHIPLREANTFAIHAANVWNSSLELREAPTRHAASAVAKLLAKSAPI